MLAAAALTFVGSSVGRFNEVGSALDDMAARTGASVEALSQLKYAATMSDTSLASLQTGLVKMGAFLNAAAGGASEATRTLTGLGLSMANLQGIAPEEQLKVFAEAISRLPPGAARSTLAMKVFGKGAVELLPLLNSGAAGIDAFMTKADQLGLTMTTQSAAAAAEFGDSLDALRLVFESLVVKVGSQFAPILTDLANTFAKLLGDNSELIQTTIRMGVAFAGVYAGIKLVTKGLQAYAATQAIVQGITGGPATWLKMGVGALIAGGAVGYLNSSFDKLNKTQEAVQESSAQTARAFVTDEEMKAEAFRRTSLWAWEANVKGKAFSRDEINARQSAELNTLKSEAAYRKLSAQIAETAEHTRQYVEAVKTMASQYDSAVLPKSIALRNEIARMAFQFKEAERSGQTLALSWDRFQNLKTAKLLDGSGWTTQFRSIGDELRILRGEITETELEFERMAEAGVDDRHIQALRQQTAERDRLRKQVDKEKADGESVKAGHAERMEAERQNLIATRNEVMASFTTPLQKSVAEFAAKSKEVRAAVEAGKLDPKAAVKFLENEQKRLQAGLQDDQKQVISSAIDVRSEESNRMLVGLLNRGTNDPAAKTNSLIEQTNRYLFDLKTAIANLALETKEFGS